MYRYLRASLRNKLGVVGLIVGFTEGAWRGQSDSVSMYVSVGEKEINHRYNIYGYVFIIDSKKLMQIWKVAFYRIEKYLKLALFCVFLF